MFDLTKSAGDMASQIVRCMERTSDMFAGSSNPFIPEGIEQRCVCEILIAVISTISMFHMIHCAIEMTKC